MRLPQELPAFIDLFAKGDLLARLASSAEVNKIVMDANKDYLHWDRFRHKYTPPSGFDLADIWRYLKILRMPLLRPLPLASPEGERFRYSVPDCVHRDLVFVDQWAAGQFSITEPQSLGSGERDRYLVNSLMEEAITSSQLEGAAVTRREAKAMLRAGRKPRNVSERMILNNYRAILELRELKHAPLTAEMIHYLHRIITQDTLESPDQAGRFRHGDEKVQVVDDRDGTIMYTPPPAARLGERVERLCAFANEKDGGPFIHPVVRAILLHFWLAYEHPYVDGNGRTARALFYWYLLRSGYWLMEYLSISAGLVTAYAQYARAFLYTETDGGDTTYFVVFQLQVIRRALDALRKYVTRKQREAAEMVVLLKDWPGLNHRQQALLRHALKHPGTIYTCKSHANSHSVTLQTARTDLRHLAKVGFLEGSSRGRQLIFLAPADLDARIRGRRRK